MRPGLCSAVVPSYPALWASHQAAALGSVLVYLDFAAPLQPARQWRGSLQAPARVCAAQLPVAMAKGSHGGHVEDIPDAALGGP